MYPKHCLWLGHYHLETVSEFISMKTRVEYSLHEENRKNKRAKQCDMGTMNTNTELNGARGVEIVDDKCKRSLLKANTKD